MFPCDTKLSRDKGFFMSLQGRANAPSKWRHSIRSRRVWRSIKHYYRLLRFIGSTWYRCSIDLTYNFHPSPKSTGATLYFGDSLPNHPHISIIVPYWGPVWMHKELISKLMTKRIRNSANIWRFHLHLNRTERYIHNFIYFFHISTFNNYQ